MKVKKAKDKAKIIHLPQETIDGLDELAKIDRTKCKPYMEKVLIHHVKTKNNHQ